MIGIAGFLLQFLLTEGLQREKAGRATNLIVSFFLLGITLFAVLGLLLTPDLGAQYTQIVFALVTERIIWGTVPSSLSLVGGLLIIVAGVWTTLQKQSTTSDSANAANAGSSTAEPDEETGLLGSSPRNSEQRT